MTALGFVGLGHMGGADREADCARQESLAHAATLMHWKGR
jgi:hypothetical protein